jgi:hypothetical protein
MAARCYRATKIAEGGRAAFLAQPAGGMTVRQVREDGQRTDAGLLALLLCRV